MSFCRKNVVKRLCELPSALALNELPSAFLALNELPSALADGLNLKEKKALAELLKKDKSLLL